MRTEIENHRLGAFIYGFMSGLGLVLIAWGLTSLIILPSQGSILYIGLTFLGVLLFAGGSCREAYLRGSLSMQRNLRDKTLPTRTRSTESLKKAGQLQTKPPVTTEQIREYPVGAETQDTALYKEETLT